MTRFATHTLAACAAVFLAISTIGAIVTVPTAQASTAPIVGMVELA